MMTDEEITLARFFFEELESRFGNYDAELREHIVAGSNRLYDMTHQSDTD